MIIDKYKDYLISFIWREVGSILFLKIMSGLRSFLRLLVLLKKSLFERFCGEFR
jgi:hypothetical protein